MFKRIKAIICDKFGHKWEYDPENPTGMVCMRCKKKVNSRNPPDYAFDQHFGTYKKPKEKEIKR